MKKAKKNILVIFLTGLVVCLLSIFYLKISDKIYIDTMTNLIVKALKIYSAPLGIILAGFFSNKSENKKIYDRNLYAVAVTISVIWNLFFSLRLLVSCLSANDSPKQISDYFENVSLFSSFLISASLSYYFFNEKKDESQ